MRRAPLSLLILALLSSTPALAKKTKKEAAEPETAKDRLTALGQKRVGGARYLDELRGRQSRGELFGLGVVALAALGSDPAHSPLLIPEDLDGVGERLERNAFRRDGATVGECLDAGCMGDVEGFAIRGIDVAGEGQAGGIGALDEKEHDGAMTFANHVGEFDEGGTTVREYADDDATVVVGTVIDPDMHDELRVTVVATGIGGSTSASRPKPHVEVVKPARVANSDVVEAVQETAESAVSKTAGSGYSDYDNPTVIRKSPDMPKADSGASQDMDYLDIPAFLRRQAD